MKLIPIHPCEFDHIYTEMEKNFILEERRDACDTRALLDEPRFTLYHMVDEDMHVGFVSTWWMGDFLFIEHLVTYEACRKRGYGRQTLDTLKEQGLPLVLEVEPPLTEFAKGRIEFYKKVGFHLNDYPYHQPPYRKGGTGVDMILMSYPQKLEDPKRIKNALYKTVYGVREVEI